MNTITINRKELKEIIRETLEDVLTERRDLISDAVVEAIEDVGLGRAIEDGLTGEYIDTQVFKKKLSAKIARLK